MPQLRAVRSQDMPTLYRKIGYDIVAENRAFRCLSELDIDGCRSAFRGLLDALDFSNIDGRDRDVILLLLDVLLRVNRTMHRGAHDEATIQENRVRLLEQFSGMRESEDARGAFLGAFDRLLAPLRGNPPVRPLVEQALAYIENNYHRRISLSEVAKKLHISPNYLSRLFRRETGHTLTFYIHRVRLEHARLLLATGGRSISEIAYLVGYQNYRDFYRNFVKYEKASPRQVQRRLAPTEMRTPTAASQETPR